MTTIFTETFKTTDYAELRRHTLQPDNRTKATADLVASVKATEGNKFAPIMVSEATGEIIDGHRRLMACEKASVPAYFVKVNIEDEALFMATINSTSRQWTTANFIDHFGVNNKDYRVLQEFLELRGATVQLLNLFVSNISYDALKQGDDISHIDYIKLDVIRRAVIFISGKFDVRVTSSMRALKKTIREFGSSFDVTDLIRKIEKAHKRGDYDGLSFITTDTKLKEVLIKTYRTKL